MGVTLRLNLFREVDHGAVFGALQTFYRRHRAALVDPVDPLRRWELHERDGAWTALVWDAGWEWRTRREAQLHVSAQLCCTGLLVFACSRSEWGYELFDCGQVVDRFVQAPAYQPAHDWFPGATPTGDPDLLAAALAGPPAHVLRGLMRQPPAQGLAVLALLRVVGLGLEPEPRALTPAAPLWRAFQVAYPPGATADG